MAKSSSRPKDSAKSDRKFEKKLEFYSKVRERVANLNAQKTIIKKRRLRTRQNNLKAYDLSSLSEVLPELNSLDQKPTQADIKLNCKSRRRTMIMKEASRLRMVLNDPVFKSDALAAIHQHLQNTQPVVDEKPKAKSGEKNKNKKKKGKKRSKSSTTGSQAMDV